MTTHLLDHTLEGRDIPDDMPTGMPLDQPLLFQMLAFTRNRLAMRRNTAGNLSVGQRISYLHLPVIV